MKKLCRVFFLRFDVVSFVAAVALRLLDNDGGASSFPSFDRARKKLVMDRCARKGCARFVAASVSSSFNGCSSLSLFVSNSVTATWSE